jgi:hypothetical protein
MAVLCCQVKRVKEGWRKQESVRQDEEGKEKKKPFKYEYTSFVETITY